MQLNRPGFEITAKNTQSFSYLFLYDLIHKQLRLMKFTRCALIWTSSLLWVVVFLASSVEDLSCDSVHNLCSSVVYLMYTDMIFHSSRLIMSQGNDICINPNYRQRGDAELFWTFLVNVRLDTAWLLAICLHSSGREITARRSGRI